MSQPAVEIVAPTEAHIDELAANLRQQDRDELDAAGHRDHRAVIATSVGMSDWAHTALAGGRVVCLFGLAGFNRVGYGTLLDPRGVPWMLGTDLVLQQRRALARLAPVYIRSMLATHPHLVNVVHGRNTVAVRWLKRSGFTLQAPHDHNGEPFHLFEMRIDRV